MRVATWNVNSIAARLSHVLRWMDSTQPDVLCLQETKCVDERFPREPFAERGYGVETFGERAYNGVAILSRFPCGEVRRGFPEEGLNGGARLIAATINGIRVINVYVPNGQAVGSAKYRFKLEWLHRLRTFLDEHHRPSDELLLCGDFNVAPEERDVHDPNLWRGRLLFSDEERRALERLRAWGLIDAFRLHVQDGGQFTWWDYRAGAFRRNAGLRIDHIWASPPVAARCVAAWIDREPRGWEHPSDHAPVVAQFSDSSDALTI